MLRGLPMYSDDVSYNLVFMACCHANTLRRVFERVEVLHRQARLFSMALPGRQQFGRLHQLGTQARGQRAAEPGGCRCAIWWSGLGSAGFSTSFWAR